MTERYLDFYKVNVSYRSRPSMFYAICVFQKSFFLLSLPRETNNGWMATNKHSGLSEGMYPPYLYPLVYSTWAIADDNACPPFHSSLTVVCCEILNPDGSARDHVELSSIPELSLGCCGRQRHGNWDKYPKNALSNHV